MQTTSVGSDRSRAPFKTRAEISAMIQELGRAYEMGAISKQEYDAGMRNAFAAEDTAYRSGYVGPGAGTGAYRGRPDRQGKMNPMQDPTQNTFEPTNRERVRQQLGLPDSMAENPVDRFEYGGAVRKYQEGGMVTPDMVPPALPNRPHPIIENLMLRGADTPFVPLPPGNINMEDMARAEMEADSRIENERRLGLITFDRNGQEVYGDEPVRDHRANIIMESLMNLSSLRESGRINRERLEEQEFLRRQQLEDEFRAREQNQIYNSTVGQRR